MIIPGYSKYDITEDGIVTVASTGKVLAQNIKATSTGYTYKRVTIVDDSGYKKQVSVIKLLAIAFLGIPDCPSYARTKDGDNTNAVLSNVLWVPCGGYDRGCAMRAPRRKKPICYDENSIALVYDTLKELDRPVYVAALSRLLELPYSTVRYSVYALIERGYARRTSQGVVVTQ